MFYEFVNKIDIYLKFGESEKESCSPVQRQRVGLY